MHSEDSESASPFDKTQRRSELGRRHGKVTHDVHDRAAVPFVRDQVPRRGAVGLRSVPRTARSGLRLRGRARVADPRQRSRSAPQNVWRFRELLPITGEPRTGFHSGCTPLVRADRLAQTLGLRELYIKDDSVNHPTLSYKDRVVSMAATRAVELGFKVFGCASTGNLANSVSAHAARLGLECYVFIPHDLELGKVLGSAIFRPHVVGVRGNYDDVNRLCTQIADKFGWGFANINLRAYYAEGAKTVGFEVVEQLGWRFPQHLVSPVAGGTLLPRIVARVPRAARDRPGRGRAAADPRGAGGRLRAGRARAPRGARVSRAGQARDDRQVDRDRQSGRRLPGGQDRQGDRRVGRRVERRRDSAGDGAAGRNRRHLHRAGRRRDARRRRQPDSLRA